MGGENEKQPRANKHTGKQSYAFIIFFQEFPISFRVKSMPCQALYAVSLQPPFPVLPDTYPLIPVMHNSLWFPEYTMFSCDALLSSSSPG